MILIMKGNDDEMNIILTLYYSDLKGRIELTESGYLSLYLTGDFIQCI
jgi:small nuclear ribonucleoprotein (snRNP)-like protein